MRYKSFVMILTALCWVLLIAAENLSAQPNNYEEQLITEKILTDFNVLIDTWKEELYFEMYQLGDSQSKSILSKVEFAQRMVDLQWKPSINPLANVNVNIIYRNLAAIHFDQQYENKVNLTQTIWKRIIFSTVLENKTWKFSLKQLINVPYEGLTIDPVEERKKAEKAKAAAEKTISQPGQAPQVQPQPGP
ncbi:MAG: hypothetical protein HQ517_17980 [SAR324 cluster bacterium]|nr:hypothetical protein [SAR324 cluster bacterium]